MINPGEIYRICAPVSRYTPYRKSENCFKEISSLIFKTVPESVIKVEQLRCVDKISLINKLGSVSKEKLISIDDALKSVFNFS
ncbi:MAG: type II toxin-antitoxin system PemK/MazF family toxin [Candidatus Woesearchaeota archaeon]